MVKKSSNHQVALFCLVFIMMIGITVAAFVSCGKNNPPEQLESTATTTTTAEKEYLGAGVTGSCNVCHSHKYETWEETGHGEAFSASSSIPETEECKECHTTGYDTANSNNGYDDATTDARRAELENVQCESCHGPGSKHNGDVTQIEKSIDPGATYGCGTCHETDYGQYYTEWLASWDGTDDDKGHSKPVTTADDGFDPESIASYRIACLPCHAGERFIAEKINGEATPSSGDELPSTLQPQTCATCHDPHSDKYEHQLRYTGTVALPEWGEAGVAIDAGPAAMCIMCHNSRVTDAETEAVPTSASSSWGSPHVGNQSEHFFGNGTIVGGGLSGGITVFDNNDFSGTIGDSKHATSEFLVPGETENEYCITCHMYADPSVASATGHTFQPSVAVCNQCHDDLEDTDPNLGKDYDGDGTAEPIEDEVEGLMERIEKTLTSGTETETGVAGCTGLGNNVEGNVEEVSDDLTEYPYWKDVFRGSNTEDDTSDDATDDEMRAAYNWVLIEHGVHGASVHNTRFVVQLLQGSWTAIARVCINSTTWDAVTDGGATAYSETDL